MSEESWHEQDAFWETFQEKMFPPASWQQAVEEVDLLIDLLEMPPGAAVLDLCCGPGRHSLELARRGYRVTGVDRTAKYLERARKAAQDEDLPLELVLADMREFVRPGAFDFALSMFTSFGYFADAAENQRVLDNYARSLKPGGRLVMQMQGKENLARNFRPRDWYEQDGALHLEERRLLDGWARIENRWILVEGGRREEYTLSHWLYSASELTGMLRQAGFSQARAHGSLDGSPYDHEARRLVVVAEK